MKSPLARVCRLGRLGRLVRILLVAAAAACAIEVDQPCPPGPQPALAISPVGPKGRLCDAVVTANDAETGVFVEELIPDESCVHRGLVDKPAPYKVVVTADGFAPVTIWPDASETLCGHSNTFSVTVTMTPTLAVP